MKTWWVLGYYHYYPSPDNFLASFYTEEEAEQFVASQKKLDNWGNLVGGCDAYDVVDVSSRL